MTPDSSVRSTWRAIDSPASVMLSATTSTSEATAFFRIQARNTAGAQQTHERNWCPGGIGIPADAAVAALMATWRHR